MNKKLRVYYAKVPNMGDVLNKDIIETCFGYSVVRNTYLTAEISGIGSGLGNYTYEEVRWKNVLKYLAALVVPEVYIWGTGFIRYKKSDSRFCKRDTHICAVRGELTKKRVEKIVGHKLDIALGDPGILAADLLQSIPEKKYEAGIIAHYKEQDHPIFQELLKRFPNSVFIDVRKTPREVIHDIAECNVIISSSLHGLILADSLEIPNIHIKVTDNLLGDGFKFDDYYSAYGLDHRCVDVNQECVPDLDQIRADYPLTHEMVEGVKRNLRNAFPFPNKKNANKKGF